MINNLGIQDRLPSKDELFSGGGGGGGEVRIRRTSL